MKKGLASVAAFALLVAFLLSALAAPSIATGNQDPIAIFDYSPSAPMPLETIVFDASASYDPDGRIVSYAWDFGDGTIAMATDPIITHSYLIDGRYTVELVVIDDESVFSSAVAVIEVSTVVFFRVVFSGTLIPLPNAKVTVYYKDGATWKAAPVGPHGFEIKYDNMTQPDLANTPEERYRNPGFTASIVRHNASNIGFDLHPSCWTVYFKFEWGSYTAYWPNETSRVYSYKKGVIETHEYSPCHKAYWDPSASTYVIKVQNIPGSGVSPTQSHPIIVGLLCPPPPEQHFLTVDTNPLGITTIPGQGWYSKGADAILTAPGTVDMSGDTRYRFSHWTIDGASQGTGVNPITVSMLANHTAIAHYVQQYLVVLDQSGLASDASGTVVTINGTAKTFTMLPNTTWVDAGSSLVYCYSPTVNSTIPGKQYGLTSTTGPASPITVSGPTNVTGNYTTVEPAECMITFAQFGVGSDFNGTVVTVDGTEYVLNELPISFLWDQGSTHTFSYLSPLVVNPGKQYNWFSTSGLTSLQSGNLTVTATGNVTGNYSTETKYEISFDQTGIGSAFTGNVVTVDGVTYKLTDLPISFWWNVDSNHTFAYASPLLLQPDSEQCVWVSSTGLSAQQGGSLTVTASGTIVGNYKTQFYLTLISDPYGVTSPSGQGWYDAGANASISTQAFLDIVPGCSRYRFNGWETTNMSEIDDPARSPTTVTMDEGKTVTATYVAQYLVTFGQTGVGSDLTDAIATIDGIDHNFTSLPAAFYWDNDTIHSFDFKSPLTVAANAKRYVWATTAGLSTMQSESITILACGNITGYYGTQYYLTVGTVPPGIAAIPGEGWYNESANVVLNAPAVINYDFERWYVNGVPQTSGVTSLTLDMNATYTALAYYNPTSPFVLTIITTAGGTTNPTPGTYTYSSGAVVNVSATANSGYILDHWEFDSANVSSILNPYVVTMNANHTLKAFFATAPPPPTVSISPMTSTMPLGQSVYFMSTVNGGTAPYRYQWYLNGAPVSGATSNSWMFTPTTSDIYFIYLMVTDALNNTVYSTTAKVIVTTTPVGGYTAPLSKDVAMTHMAAYAFLTSLMGTTFVVIKRKRK